MLLPFSASETCDKAKARAEICRACRYCMHMMLQNEANNKLIISSKSLLSLLTKIGAIIGKFPFHWFVAEITLRKEEEQNAASDLMNGKTAGGCFYKSIRSYFCLKSTIKG